jgi:hypothetical protein
LRDLPALSFLVGLLGAALLAAAPLPGQTPMPVRADPLVDVVPPNRTAQTRSDARAGLAIDPADARHLLAATPGGATYASRDGGAAWTLGDGRGTFASLAGGAAAAMAALQSRGGRQEHFTLVPAPALDGTLYAAAIQNYNGTPRLVVVRDDAWGASAAPFSALTDPSDSRPGHVVVRNAASVAIAVDPTDGDRVYVAYGEGGSPVQTIHVRCSLDRGNTWSDDLLIVKNALDVSLAMDAFGNVAVLYQHLAAGQWRTEFARTSEGGVAAFDGPAGVLAAAPANAPPAAGDPFVGARVTLASAGRNYFGLFAGPRSGAPAVLDPFFFEIRGLAPGDDFYVRDWTNDAQHADDGSEPSTNTDFFTTSDVWNRRSSAPGSFANDRPSDETPAAGPGATGDDWAFARVHRSAAGEPTSVRAHFLLAKFGTGSNFVDAGSGEPDIGFDDAVAYASTGPGPGAWISAAYHWHLGAAASPHLSLAVELTAAGSRFLPPSLAGAAPGRLGTGLRIVADNHKAERNEQLTTIPADAPVAVTAYAIVHNGALIARDVALRLGYPAGAQRYLRGASASDVSAESNVASAAGDVLTVHAVRPGENRWIGVTLKTAAMPAGASAYVTFEELNALGPALGPGFSGDRTETSGGVASDAGGAGGAGGAERVVTDGFAIGVRAVATNAAVASVLATRRGIAGRLEAGFGATASAADSPATGSVTLDAFATIVRGALEPHLASDLAKIGPSDPLGIHPLLYDVRGEAAKPQLVADVASLLNGVDANLTQLQLERGDPADIPQLVRWQRMLFLTRANLAKLSCAPDVVKASNTFLRTGDATPLGSAYPKHLADVIGCLREGLGPREALGALVGSNLSGLERAHRAMLLALAR